jgi:hypothetical protein
MNLSFRHIAAFLTTDQNRSSRWLSYFGLGIGVLLLLCSIQMYINIDALLKNKDAKKDGYDYISITKKVTNENMAQDHSFSDADMKELEELPLIDDATGLVANKFLVKATGGGAVPFTADMFLEALDESFIDTIPPAFNWKEGQTLIPVIISSDYLELYNTVFAPSRDLPQVSEKTLSSIIVQLEFIGNSGSETFRGNIVAVSDRINSVLVPKNFLEWANQRYGNKMKSNPSRIFLKTKDANNPELLNFLQQREYQVNKDKTKFGRVKQVLQMIVTGLAGFGVLVVLLAMVLFSFYLQLMIAKSKENLQLLLTIGYSPKWLSKTVAKKWVPVYIIVIIMAVLVTVLLQWSFGHFVMKDRASLSPLVHWAVLATAVLLLILSVAVNFRLVKKLLYKL